MDQPHSKTLAATAPAKQRVQFDLKALLLAPRSPNAFLDLPTEIHLEIFSHLPAASQVCLGLTSKTMARVLAIQDLNLLRDHWTRDEKRVLMGKLVDWMPQTCRLCEVCLTYKPKAVVTQKKLFGRVVGGAVVVDSLNKSVMAGRMCAGCWDTEIKSHQHRGELWDDVSENEDDTESGSTVTKRNLIRAESEEEDGTGIASTVVNSNAVETESEDEDSTRNVNAVLQKKGIRARVRDIFSGSKKFLKSRQ